MSSAPLDQDRWQRSQVVLLDIELARDSWNDSAFQGLIAPFPEETRSNAETLLAHVQDLTRRDIKAVYLKQLQGKLWKTGYEGGHLKTPLFEDVIPTLESWKERGKTLAIFSSGSVQAQLQFFSFVQSGNTTQDLKPLFAAHFDPTIAGSKLDKVSYEKICSELGRSNTEVTFLTDNVKGDILRAHPGRATVFLLETRQIRHWLVSLQHNNATLHLY
ncbi:hypothetical protein GRF29_1g958977 [Pseudopithomyces chartarum]|uniref:2,3-diketo-5-methylthio-1-phosphopentane phosphatase n=1 Tax=Pseudopithomyces chartarum TaxID=1892770 RepID=A0AAN6RLH5_9PLEO|nr:hypothetical protein GRF29_1g958977 [Pseudopithomyces chartarum]